MQSSLYAITPQHLDSINLTSLLPPSIKPEHLLLIPSARFDPFDVLYEPQTTLPFLIQVTSEPQPTISLIADRLTAPS
ncbi:hypothetical protein ONZ45_g13417 [Pleurotus djamor]|nr:hypothetical protein ONZ45_g13417 [Pleurotus djamor]